VWLRRLSAAVVAADAAYASYEHQRRFAAGHGALPVPAGLWPLSVDGVVILASLALLNPALRTERRRVRWSVRVAFTLGITVSLVANIAAADQVSWQAVLVAAWPPVALLLSVELLAHTRPATRHDTERDDVAAGRDVGETDRDVPGPAAAPGEPVSTNPAATRRGQAQQVMWRYYQAARAAGRDPSGAELDRVAGTRDYGRAVLARWRRDGRIPPDPDAGTDESDIGEVRAA
jgi:hypothetical protein